MRSFLVAAATIAIYAPIAHAAVEDDLRDGDKYFEDGDYKKAATAYDRAISAGPSQVSAEAYGKRAGIFLILKDFKGGLAFVEMAKTRYPSAPEVMEQEALLLWYSDHKDEAIKVAEKVVKAKPSAFSNQSIVGEYYYGRDSVKVAAAYEAYLANRPSTLEDKDVLPRVRLGFSYLANARSVLGDGDEGRAKQLYDKARDQFEYVQRKLGKKPNAMVNSDNGLCAAYSGLGHWDQAISVCERVIQDPKRIDPQGSVYYNLATAYLARKQTQKARSAGNEFIRVRKNEARGFMLIGDTFFEDRRWTDALDQYLRAEQSLKANQQREQVQLSIRLGKTYRRLPAPAGQTNPNLAKAIDKLSTAYNANPGSIELAIELGGAEIEARQDGKATALTSKVMQTDEYPKAPPEQRAQILVISGKAQFNQKKFKEARDAFEEARTLRQTDITIQRNLVITINEQAFAAGTNYKLAEQLLGEAGKVDPSSTMTLTNQSVLAIERGDCTTAQGKLNQLASMRGSDAVVTQRLLGRAWLCGAKPDIKKATTAFENAEKEAKKANAQLALAEIYTEWAPYIWDQDLGDAIEKLDQAVVIGAQDPEIGPAAKRNLALALYRRGWQQMKAGKGADAATDFEKANRDPSVLKGVEPLAFQFSYALALLDARPQDAAKEFRSLAGKGGQSSYLKPVYQKDGPAFFQAYANYRNQTGAQRETACSDLAKFQGSIGGRTKEIVAACWEAAGYDHWRNGSSGAASKALQNAQKQATSADQKRRIDLDLITLNLTKNDRSALEAMGGNPPESLVNLGIVYDMLGMSREAYEAWVRAKGKVNYGPLQKWIDAKKRIYGY